MDICKYFRIFAAEYRKKVNSIGEIWRFTSFGESHGAAIGGVLDGVPAGVHIDMDMIREALDRRAGRDSIVHRTSVLRTSNGVSPRAKNEKDEVEWLSGVLDGVTIGTPVAFLIRNTDARSQDYDFLKHHHRPGHADATYELKYGIRDWRGGGRASAREPVARVVAGQIAMQQLSKQGIAIHAELIQVGPETDPARFDDLLRQTQAEGDTIGGIVRCTKQGLPAGVGEPIFDKLSSRLAAAMLSINGCKGFDYGIGFDVLNYRGSELYDLPHPAPSSGGIDGGISNGDTVTFRCVFKPASSVPKVHRTSLHVSFRSDSCIAVRAVPVVEAMTALTLIDLINQNQKSKI